MKGRNHKTVPGEIETAMRVKKFGTPRIWKEENKKIVEYPCSIYLHNALSLISRGKSDSAYEEICWAILKSGGDLTDDEKIKFEEIVKERSKK